MNYKIRCVTGSKYELWITVNERYSQVFTFNSRAEAQRAMQEALEEDKKWPINFATHIQLQMEATK